MNLKNYFFFTKTEKAATIILLVSITVAAFLFFYLRSDKKAGDTADYTITDQMAEFEKSLLAAKDSEADSTKPHSQKKIYTKFPKQIKLQQGETIELNSADTTLLKMIPGIGSGYANRIVKYRNLLGGYATISQLKEVWGMDDYLYADIVPFITLETPVRRLSVNKAPLEELSRHPYLNYKQAKVITDIRERKGNIESMKRLTMLEEFNDRDIKRLTPYLAFD